MFDTMAKNTLVPLLIRIGLAVIFIFHGLDKIQRPGAEYGAAWHGSSDHSPHPLPKVVQMLVAWGELVCGIALAVGFLTRLAALGIAVIMAGAIYIVHGQYGFNLRQEGGNMGFEYNFAILVMCAVLVLIGGGTLAADRFLRVRPRNPAALN